MSGPNYVKDDSLWQLLHRGIAKPDDQLAAAEWIEWAMKHVPSEVAQRRKDGLSDENSEGKK